MKLVLYPAVEARRLQQIKAVAVPMHVVNCVTEVDATREATDADAFFGKITPGILAVASQMRWVQSPTASLEHYIFPELANHSLQLTNMRGLFHDNIADHVFGYMLCFARNLHHYIRLQSQNTWKPFGGKKEGQVFFSGPAITTDVDLAHTTLSDATLGVIGLGSIGSEIARRGVCFGMRVVAVDSNPRKKPAGVDKLWSTDQLNDLLKQSDYVVIAAPHTPQTEKLFRASQFSLMKSSAILINIGRGVIVDLMDLVAALRTQEIGGAALDVFETEPLPADDPLWGFDNVILTPHVSGHSPRIAERHLNILLDNIRHFKREEPLVNVVDKYNWF